MYSIIFIAMLSIASGQSVDIGTDCECSVTEISAAATYEVGASHSSLHSSGECVVASTDPLAVWSGVGVEFKGTIFDTDGETFDYRVDCERPCSISLVVISGTAWCGGDTTLQLYNGDRSVLLAERDFDFVDENGDNYFSSSLTAGTDYLTSFRIVETGDTCGTWRCRDSLSIVAEADPSFSVTSYEDECDALPIDTILSKCSANYAASGADILALQSAYNSTSNAIKALQSVDTTTDAAVVGLQADLNLTNDAVQALQSADTITEAAVEALQAELNFTSDAVQALQSADTATNTEFEVLQAELVGLTANHTSVEARLRELEKWQETLLSMSAAKGIRSAEEDMGPSSSVATIDLSAYGMQALVVCLVMVNVVLLGCLCVNNRPKNVVYDAVRGSDQEELCA